LYSSESLEEEASLEEVEVEDEVLDMIDEEAEPIEG
jgi:hypothetical protein